MDEKKLGLEKIIELNEQELSYEFNDLCVWKSKDNKLYFAINSGCSCSYPFEDYTTIESLTPITKKTFNDFENAVKNFPAEGPDKIEALVKVREFFK